ncbi:MAG: transporter [Gammaproteobacteria bacterium]|nr:transporter [Gammaproteobacteria bacterium]
MRRVRYGAIIAVLLVPVAVRADDKAECLAREAAKGHHQSSSKLICQLRRVFQNRIRNKPEAEPVEMTVGSPPMISDDTDTPGPGSWEINLVFYGAWSRDRRAFEAPLVDLNYGIGERVQLKYQVPYALEHSTGLDASGERISASERGVGDSIVGLKYRFYDDEERGFSLGLYPQVRFRTPGARRALSAGGTGFILPLLLTKEFASFSITADLGIERSTLEHHSDYFASVGLGTRITDRLAVMVEIAGESLRDPDARRCIVNLGLRRKLNDKQAVVAAIGHDLHASDGASSTYFTLAYQRVFGD